MNLFNLIVGDGACFIAFSLVGFWWFIRVGCLCFELDVCWMMLLDCG